MRIKILILGLIFLFIYGCATAPAPRQIVNTFPIGKSFDDVWQAVIESFSELQLPILNMEKDSGLITTDWISFTGKKGKEYADCGGLGMNYETNRTGRFNIFVKKISADSCEVKINCMFRQTITDALSSYTQTRDCVSTGKFEAEMFNLIKMKLGL